MGKNFRSPSQATTTSVHSFSELTRGERFRQKTKKNCRSCAKFMYDKESHTFCNKSCKDWFCILLYYIIFMAILCGVLFAMLVLLIYIAKTTRTMALFSKDDLVSDGSPALGISPRLPKQVTTLIWYTHKKTKHSVTADTYVSLIDKLLKPYEELKNHSIYVNCTATIPRENEYCIFTKKELGPCGTEGYGYKDDKPCIYLKLNKLKGWRPQYARKRRDSEKMENEDHIHIACDGITCFDRDHMGNISYYPGPFFKDHFFPYDGSPHYRSPLIGVQFENLNRGFVIGIKCFVLKSIVNLQDESLHMATAFFYIDAKR
ncbi:ATP1B1 [Trypoxylus dichotomus]